MTAIARIGDKTTGICYAHESPITVGGTIVTGSTKTTSEGFSVARLGDLIVADCGHYAKIITASDKGTTEGIGIARLGDKGDGSYKCTIISGSTKDTLA